MATQREKVKGGERTFVGCYISTELKKVIDRMAQAEKKNRSEMMEILLKKGMQASMEEGMEEGPSPEDFDGVEP